MSRSCLRVEKPLAGEAGCPALVAWLREALKPYAHVARCITRPVGMPDDLAAALRQAGFSAVRVALEAVDVVYAHEEERPFSPGSVYVNFLGLDEGEDRVKAAHGANCDRLAAIKARYDPTNLFRLNQNIKPAG